MSVDKELEREGELELELEGDVCELIVCKSEISSHSVCETPLFVSANARLVTGNTRHDLPLESCGAFGISLEDLSRIVVTLYN